MELVDTIIDYASKPIVQAAAGFILACWFIGATRKVKRDM